MVLPLYLAMTPAEMGTNTQHPDNLAYMACHFSPYGTGLSNLPKALPEGSMLILNDRIPWDRHDISTVVDQLLDTALQTKSASILLDFQRTDAGSIPDLIDSLLDIFPCPVGVSHLYAHGRSCPVFLPPVPPDIPVRDYLAPWQGREVWLEAAKDGCTITLTKQGNETLPLPYPHPETGHWDKKLHCHYCIESTQEKAVFTLYRTEQDLTDLLEEAHMFGVTQAVGLWQELRNT